MKIAVLVSGGVDSSVALKLLKDQGHQITAFYLKIWLEDELSFLGDCPWEEDLAFVRSVCDQVGVPLEVMSLQKEYWDHVVSYTVAEVKEGRTPNPDILCNSRIKFGFFLDALGVEYDKVATGHYAQVAQEGDSYYLKRAPDAIKDQTYFLSHLSQAQLSRALFPIGYLEKPEVRALAQKFNLPNKDRKDSQGICFLGKLKFKDFIHHYLGNKSGDLVEYETGKKLGEHQGFWYFTIGQRQGTGLSGGPWYVVAKDCAQNVVYVSRDYYDENKKRNTFEVAAGNWIGVAGLPAHQPLLVKMRHGKHDHECMVSAVGEGHYQVTLQEQDQGIAPGQFAVFYAGDRCLGGAVIVK